MRRVISTLTLLVLIPCLGLAQGAQDNWDNLKQLQAGQKIEVVQMDLKRLAGPFLGFSQEAISLRVKQGSVTVARDQVLRVSLREHSKRARNALIGTAIGAGIGVGLGLAAANTGVHETGEEYFVMGIFTPIGAGVGAGLGAALPSYETIYRAQKPRK